MLFPRQTLHKNTDLSCLVLSYFLCYWYASYLILGGDIHTWNAGFLRNVEVEGDEIKLLYYLLHKMSGQNIINASWILASPVNITYSVNIQIKVYIVLLGRLWNKEQIFLRFLWGDGDKYIWNKNQWALSLVGLFQSSDPSLGRKIEWFLLLYALRCFSPSQKSDKLIDIC